MNTMKETRVIMLPSKQETQIVLSNNKLIYGKTNYDLRDKYCIQKPNYVHLYFLIDEEIKEGGCFINDLNQILKCTGRSEGYIDFERGFNSKPTSCRKVIASTDKSLTYIDIIGLGNVKTKQLPRPSDAFIQKYVEEANKGKFIDKVLVEYEGDWDEHYQAYYAETVKPKIAPDNTITINPIVETWDDIFKDYLNSKKESKYSSYKLLDWLKENYNNPTKKYVE